MTQNEIIRNLFAGDDFYNEEEFNLVIDLREWDAERTFMKGDYQHIAGIICTINNLISEGKILVHCHGGMDRSPFVVALYLHIYKKIPPIEAYELVKKRRPETIIHDDWMNNYLQWVARAIDADME